jgi:diadenosine tetraphosphate (Ap4A) HIT family hydrolase
MSNEQEFQLDTRLENDTYKIATWPLSDLLLMNDSQYPWCILVPRIAGLSELYQLSRSQRQQLDLESTFLSKTLMAVFEGEKLNIAALGNVVKQLHIHHVIRYSNDLSWPAPVWGKFPPKAYSEMSLKQCFARLSDLHEPDWAAIALSNT